MPIPAATASTAAIETRTPGRPSGISAPIATPTPVPTPAATPIQYQSPRNQCKHRFRASAWQRFRFPTFQAADHGKPELRRTGAVDHAVVERHCDRPHPADDDFPVVDDRARSDPADAEDRHLGWLTIGV
jgi:hypothetical protein